MAWEAPSACELLNLELLQDWSVLFLRLTMKPVPSEVLPLEDQKQLWCHCESLAVSGQCWQMPSDRWGTSGLLCVTHQVGTEKTNTPGKVLDQFCSFFFTVTNPPRLPPSPVTLPPPSALLLGESAGMKRCWDTSQSVGELLPVRPPR